MNKKDSENQKDPKSAGSKPSSPEWLEEYKQRKIEREADDTLEIEVPEETEPESKSS